MDTTPASRLPLALAAAAQCVKQAARAAAHQASEALGVTALAFRSVAQREAHLGAQFELSRAIKALAQDFDLRLDQGVERDLSNLQGRNTTSSATTWDELSLVDDQETNLRLETDRLATALTLACEGPLKTLDGMAATVMGWSAPNTDHNPLRPFAFADALMRSAAIVSPQAEVQALVRAELGRSGVLALRQAYGQIIEELQRSGIKPVVPVYRAVAVANAPSRPSGAVDGQTPSHAAPHTGAQGQATSDGVGPQPTAAPSTEGPRPFGAVTPFIQGDSRSAAGDPVAPHSGARFGTVDSGFMALMRDLAFRAGSQAEAVHDTSVRPASSALEGPGPAEWANVIHLHRDALREASRGGVDHIVIDVVAGLFDEIICDPKLPAPLAGQVARLQLPVLRVALGDSSFFSSRKHPVRALINRMASLGIGFHDFEGEAGQRFLGHVRQLVQDIVDGDFDQVGVYEQRLQALEQFVADELQHEAQATHSAAALLARREEELRTQQELAHQWRAGLAGLEMPEFVRDFLTGVWSQASARAQHAAAGGADTAKAAAQLQFFRDTAKELVLSVQPKGQPEQRKHFLTQLPGLMRSLSEGTEAVAWPDEDRQAFFGQLLNAHAESLRGRPLSALAYNLIGKQLEATLAGSTNAGQGYTPSAAPAPVTLELPAEDTLFQPSQAAQIGLLQEADVDWQGPLDIDLSAEPPVQGVDLQLPGLPALQAAPATASTDLADQVQAGMAYRMHVQGEWKTVRLSHISASRSFFVFTHGPQQLQTISVTQRMLRRLCASERLTEVESSALLERATARARRQLAALSATLH